MNMISATVRIPSAVKQEALQLVECGYYKNLSDFVISAMRDELKEHKVSSSVRDVRLARKKIWAEYLKKAGGDVDKALDIMHEEGEKEYAKDPAFWKY